MIGVWLLCRNIDLCHQLRFIIFFCRARGSWVHKVIWAIWLDSVFHRVLYSLAASSALRGLLPVFLPFPDFRSFPCLSVCPFVNFLKPNRLNYLLLQPSHCACRALWPLSHELACCGPQAVSHLAFITLLLVNQFHTIPTSVAAAVSGAFYRLLLDSLCRVRG